MSIILQKVLESEKQVLKNLYSLYLHDLSSFTSHLTINNDGLFEYEDIDLFWAIEGITPYFIMEENTIIGFFLLLHRPFLKKDHDFGINDMFILNQYKRKGFGRQAVEEIFKENKGSYFIIELCENVSAVSFWKKLFQELEIVYEEKEEIVDGERCYIHTFKS
ncbi:GNAT family N-acetyltransferase [Alkalihalobacterium bogoriense]|uniref:GNAT family N-acetyltransferase n=1 Tax=Alkalihalobacterium bogoriense TaxID=246272 RepID=UPI00047B893F|nr:GNAT family N-acetyltransferase [Alkalihalobacterium bogoriense]